MSRVPILLVALVVSLPAAASADTFGGWQYTAPPGYTAEPADDHVSFTKQTGSSFCSIALFEARALDASAAQETAFEWTNVVTHTFKARIQQRATAQTKQGVTISKTTAMLTSGSGDTYGAIHYVVMPPGMIGSVLLTSSSLGTLRGCERAATPFVSGLAIDWSSPKFTDPEARVETPVGRWAIAGPVSREYTFVADGTYRFRSQEPVKTGDRIVEEAGTYAWVGNQVTLTPSRASATIVANAIVKSTSKLPLEKTTYTWGKRYNVESNTWDLVLTPRKPTRRDGTLPPDAAYRYNDHATPAWDTAPGPGV